MHCRGTGYCDVSHWVDFGHDVGQEIDMAAVMMLCMDLGSAEQHVW